MSVHCTMQSCCTYIHMCMRMYDIVETHCNILVSVYQLMKASTAKRSELVCPSATSPHLQAGAFAPPLVHVYGTYVRMCIYTYVCMYVSMCVRTYVCMFVVPFCNRSNAVRKTDNHCSLKTEQKWNGMLMLYCHILCVRTYVCFLCCLNLV